MTQSFRFSQEKQKVIHFLVNNASIISILESNYYVGHLTFIIFVMFQMSLKGKSRFNNLNIWKIPENHPGVMINYD